MSAGRWFLLGLALSLALMLLLIYGLGAHPLYAFVVCLVLGVTFGLATRRGDR